MSVLEQKLNYALFYFIKLQTFFYLCRESAFDFIPFLYKIEFFILLV